MENAKELQKLAQVFNTDNIITNDDIEQVLKGILVIMNSFKKDNQSLNKETKEIVENLFNKILNEHDKLKESVNRETSDTKDEVNEKLEKSIAQMKKMCEDLMLAKPKDGEKGEDADEEEIVEKVLAQIKLPETEILTGDDIANRLESLEGDARLDFKALKNVPESKQNIINGGGWRNLYQMHDVEISAPTDNQVLTYDGTTNTWKNENATGGAIAFTDLTDVPASYTGAGSKGVRVNAGETALEFYTVVDTDEKVKYAADDTSAGYLGAKTVAGTGITLSEGTGGDADKLKITNSAPDQTVAFTGGTNVTIGGTYPNFTITDNSQVSGSYQASDTQLTSLAGLSYAGNGGKFIRVNAGETDFELATVAGGTIDGSGTTNELTYWVDSDTLGALAVATYPSLTELSYVKGVTSAIQTQIGTKAAHATTMTIAGTANQITSSAGSQDLSANRTWTLSLPADVLIPAVLTVPNTGLHLLDSDASHDLIIKPGSNLTADKTLTITTGDADVNLNLTAVTDEYVLAYDAGTNTWRGVVASSGGQSPYDAIVAPSGGDYTDLESAIDAGKVNIFVKPGTYTVSGAIDIDVAGITITGAGWTTIFQAGAGLNANVFNITVANVKLSNFKIDGNSANNISGNLISIATAGTQCIIDKIWFHDGEDCAIIEDTAGRDNKITNCYFSGTTYTDVINMAGQRGTISSCSSLNTLDFTSNLLDITGTRYSITNCVFECASGASETIIDLQSATSVTMTGCALSTGTMALWVYLGTRCVLDGNTFYSSGKADGANVGSISTNGSENVISNNYLFQTTAGGDGYAINVNGQRTSVTGNVIMTVGRHGIYIQSAYTTITGNVIQDASTATNNTYSGIYIDGVDNNTVVGNVVRSNAANKIKYGVEEATGCNNNTIEGNTVVGFVTGAVLPTGVDTIAFNNSGATIVEEKKVVYMKNTSGGALANGDVVVLKAVAAGNEVTTTTTAGDNKVFGIATAAIADTASGYIQVLGKTTALKVNGTTDIAIGDYLTCFTTAKIAAKAVAGDMVFAMALEAYTTDDSNGVIDALLITPRLI